MRKITSPVLVGRDAELSAIRRARAVAADGRCRIVLLSGDAGIGKTRLIAEACDQAVADGGVAVVGGSVHYRESSVAYAPLIEAVRELGRTVGDDELARLLGPAQALFGGGRPDGEPAERIFEHVLNFVVRLGHRQPTMLVFEDLHWADSSTLDLLAFLARNLRDAAVVLVLTYRSDEVHRRHPLRPLIRDLARYPHVDRIALGGLNRRDLADLLGALGETEPDPARLDALLARTEGNPFYVEELLVAASQLDEPESVLPAELADVILARAGQLAQPTQEVLRWAAVLGRHVDDLVLADASGLAAETVTAALRDAVERNLLVLDSAGCRFRHALVVEALYADLLPGERQRMHRRVAQVLQPVAEAGSRFGTAAPADVTRPYGDDTRRVCWSTVAQHWHAAYDVSRAFAASVRAGTECSAEYAFADVAEHFERALDLWDQVAEPAAVAGMDRAELLLRAADAAHYASRSPRAVSLVRAAYDALEPTAGPERRALVLERVGQIHWTRQQGRAATEAYQRAVALVADRPASPEQAFVLSALGQNLMVRGRHREAESRLREAVEVAGRVAAERVAGHALASLGCVEAELGRPDDGVATMRLALARCADHGTTEDVARCYSNLCNALYLAGRYREAADLAGEGMRYCERTGHLEHFGESITGERIVALTCLGAWPEAERAHRELTGRIHGRTPYLELRWLRLLLWRGDHDLAAEVVGRCLAATRHADPPFRALALLRAGELAAARRHWDDARSVLAEGLHLCRQGDGQYDTAYGIALAMATEADRIGDAAGSGPQSRIEVSRARERADELRAAADAVRDRVGVDLSDLLPETSAWLATADAHHARAWERDTGTLWEDVAVVWDGIGVPYPSAVARFHGAEAALRGGDRAGAATMAARALNTAENLGAGTLVTRVRLLARRARLNLATPPPVPERSTIAKLGVTGREVEVLTLLAVGRTNRQIAESLSISEKTVSVHVTNLLRKLDVPNRVAAAAVAQRHGIGIP